MSFSVLTVASSVVSLPLTKGQWVDLIPQQTIVGTGGPVQFLGYARGVAVDTQLQILIDGSPVSSYTGDPNLTAVVPVATGSHTVNFQAFAVSDDSSFVPTVVQRGLTVIALS